MRIKNSESTRNRTELITKMRTDTDIVSQSTTTLVGHVDVLEVALAEAFREYRYRVEDILEEHTEVMEEAQQAHEMELARLRAENAQLRDRLGMKSETELPQAAMYDATAEAQKKKATSNGSMGKSKKAHKFRDSTQEDQSSPALRKVQSKNVPTGSWQPFVAWVPAGASLQQPQPWTPLNIDGQQPPNPGGAQQASPTTNKRGGKQEFVGIMPSATGESLHRSKNGNTSDETVSQGSGEKAYEVNEFFAATDDELALSRQIMQARSTARMQQSRKGSSCSDTVREADEFFSEFLTTRPWFIIHPHSRQRIAWDLSSLSLVIYDMITIPMAVFTLPESLFLKFMEWTTRLFWTFDMGMSSLTGVVLTDGSVQFDVRFILKRYLKTWLALDIFIVVSDWMELIAAGAGGAGAFGRLSRSFRIVRVVRLLRLVRMREVMEQITERVQSDKLSFMLSILKLSVFIISMAHILGCIWWGIGTNEEESVNSWVVAARYHNASLDAQYLASLHWSLSQFSGGMDEISPESPLERFFAVIVWIFAFMAAAVIVSNLTSSLTQMHIIGGTRSRQLAMLRKYLKQNAISSNLALRMQRSAQHALSADLTADLIELLPVVSESLRAEMHFEMYSVALRSHSFFAWCISDCPQVVRRFCHYAMSTLIFSASDCVFTKGESPSEPRMYVVAKGTLEYVTHAETTPISEKVVVAEAVLWTLAWRHQGTLTATSDSKLAALDAKTFQEIAARFQDTATFDARVYAQDYVAHLNSLEFPHDLTMTNG